MMKVTAIAGINLSLPSQEAGRALIMLDSYDIIVVGAGPAGSCAAWRAALQGLTVLMIEKDPEIGLPVRCAEGISQRGVHAFLGDPDSRYISASINRVRLTSPDGTSVALSHELDGYILDRHLFDKALAGKAESAGAEILTGSPALGMKRSNEMWELRVNTAGSDVVIPARGIIAADGIKSMVGRWAGLASHTPVRGMESCYQYTLTDLDIEQNVIEMSFGSRISPGGYSWIFPKGDGKANVGLGVIRDVATEKITARDYLDRWIENRFPGAGYLRAFAGGVIISKALYSISSDGMILVGDAAHQINPLSGAGISSGMRAGWMGGGILAEQIAAGDTSARALKRYDAMWKRTLGDLHESHLRLAEVVLNMKDEQFNKLAGELSQLPEKKCTMYAAVSGAVRTSPSLLLKLAGYFRSWRSISSGSGYPEVPPDLPRTIP